MKWLFAGLTFAAVVALAVATAAMRAENIDARARLLLLTERIDAARVRLSAERSRCRDATRPEELIRRWQELIDRRFAGFDDAVGGRGT